MKNKKKQKKKKKIVLHKDHSQSVEIDPILSYLIFYLFLSIRHTWTIPWLVPVMSLLSASTAVNSMLAGW